jgi:hypothetical protein
MANNQKTRTAEVTLTQVKLLMFMSQPLACCGTGATSSVTNLKQGGLAIALNSLLLVLNNMWHMRRLGAQQQHKAHRVACY